MISDNKYECPKCGHVILSEEQLKFCSQCGISYEANIPKMLKDFDFSHLKYLVEECVEGISSGGFEDDYIVEIYEQAIETFYGADVWDTLTKREEL